MHVESFHGSTVVVVAIWSAIFFSSSLLYVLHLYILSLPTLIFLLTRPPPVHGVYNTSTGPLGVVFVGLLLHESTTSTMWACLHGTSGVVLAAAVVMRRFTHANLKSTSSTTPARVPLGSSVSWACYCMSPRRLQCQHACMVPRELCSPLPPSSSTSPMGVAFQHTFKHSKVDFFFFFFFFVCVCNLTGPPLTTRPWVENTGVWSALSMHRLQFSFPLFTGVYQMCVLQSRLPAASLVIVIAGAWCGEVACQRATSWVKHADLSAKKTLRW